MPSEYRCQFCLCFRCLGFKLVTCASDGIDLSYVRKDCEFLTLQIRHFMIRRKSYMAGRRYSPQARVRAFIEGRKIPIK